MGNIRTGAHYCHSHQGNGSHYDSINCDLCKEMLRADSLEHDRFNRDERLAEAERLLGKLLNCSTDFPGYGINDLKSKASAFLAPAQPAEDVTHGQTCPDCGGIAFPGKVHICKEITP